MPQPTLRPYGEEILKGSKEFHPPEEELANRGGKMDSEREMETKLLPHCILPAMLVHTRYAQPPHTATQQ